MKKKIIINKHSTDTTDSTTYDTMESTESTSYETETTETQQVSHRTFFNIATTGYKKTRYGSKQDKLTQKEINEKLVGWRYLSNYNELEELPLFTTWVKYINVKTGKFRTGGFLLKTNLPNYIVLYNPNMNYITWSVQLDENDLYIKDEPVDDYTESSNETEQERNEREQMIKNKLYQLYIQGRLEKKPRK